MKKIILLLLPAFLVFSCKNKKPKNNFLSPANLTSQFFTINPNQDTVLKTGHGSIVKFPAHSIKGGPGKTIQVEIKEAITAEEIFAAGLLTNSDGQLLKSSGMIYINATIEGKNAELIKPLPVSMPGNEYDPAMKIFKGEMMKDSTINWIKPVQPDSTIPKQMIENGKAIFLSKCASCHFDAEGAFGSLNAVAKKSQWKDRSKLYDYIHNPAKFTVSSDYAKQLVKNYGVMMTAFPDLSNRSIDNIFLYLESEENLNKANLPDTLPAIINPCGYDTTVIIEEEIPDHIRGSKADTGKLLTPADTTPVVDIQDIPFVDSTVTVARLNQEFEINVYQFEIEDFGWYNIDAFIDDYPGLTDIIISGRVLNGTSADVLVYLFCPEKKFNQYAINFKNDSFNFNKKDSGIPFFLNQRVILFGVSKGKGETKYAIKEFYTKKSQFIELQLKPVSEKELLEKIRAIKLEGIRLNAVKTETVINAIPCDGETDKVKKDTSIYISPK